MLAMTPTRRAAGAVLGLALAVAASAAVSGCGGQPEEPATGLSTAQSWTEPTHYAYTLLTTCGERGGLGLFRVWVRDGRVERAKPMRQWSDLLPLREMPSVGDIIQIAAAAQRDGADEVRVTRASDGRPRWVSIDYMTNAIDDEACYRVTDLTPLSG